MSENDQPEYSMYVKGNSLFVTGEIQIESGEVGEIEIEFNGGDGDLANHLRDLAQKLDHPEIIKTRVGVCKECNGVLDLQSFELGDKKQEVEVCRDCNILAFKGTKIKL